MAVYDPGQPQIMDTQLGGVSPTANPFGMPQGRGIAPPAPPIMPQRSLPMGPMGGVPPGLAQAIAAWQQAQAAQASAPPPMVQPPMTSPPIQPQAQGQGGFWQNILRRVAQEKFNRGMPTPLADRAGWSAGWGERPLGMQQPALPNQPAFPSTGFAAGEPSGGGGGGAYTNPVAKPPAY